MDGGVVNVDLERIRERVETLHRLADETARQAVQYAIDCGVELNRVKQAAEQLQFDFGEWCQGLTFSSKRVQRYMRAARCASDPRRQMSLHIFDDEHQSEHRELLGIYVQVDWRGIGDRFRRIGYRTTDVARRMNYPISTIDSWFNDGREPLHRCGASLLNFLESAEALAQRRACKAISDIS